MDTSVGEKHAFSCLSASSSPPHGGCVCLKRAQRKESCEWLCLSLLAFIFSSCILIIPLETNYCQPILTFDLFAIDPGTTYHTECCNNFFQFWSSVTTTIQESHPKSILLWVEAEVKTLSEAQQKGIWLSSPQQSVIGPQVGLTEGWGFLIFLFTILSRLYMVRKTVGSSLDRC